LIDSGRITLLARRISRPRPAFRQGRRSFEPILINKRDRRRSALFATLGG
jgi:hypothetical protein